MKSKDQQLLEEAYKKVCENMMPPQPGGDSSGGTGPAYNDKVSNALWGNADTQDERLAAGAYDLYHDNKEFIEKHGGKSFPENNVEFWKKLVKSKIKLDSEGNYYREGGLDDDEREAVVAHLEGVDGDTAHYEGERQAALDVRR